MNTGGPEIVTTYAINGGNSPATQQKLNQLQAGQDTQQTEIEQLQSTVGPGGVLDGGQA